MEFGFVFQKDKIIKIEIQEQGGKTVMEITKHFDFPKSLDSSSEKDSTLMIKGTQLREFSRNTRVYVITNMKSGDRIKYVGDITVSTNNQLNIKILESRDSEVLEERRRYFKIKVDGLGRVYFLTRGEECIRFDEPLEFKIMDINIGGVFLYADFKLAAGDILNVEIDLFVDYKLNATVQILRIQKDEGGNVVGYGCAFMDINSSQEDYIGKYIYKEQLLQRQREKAKNMTL